MEEGLRELVLARFGAEPPDIRTYSPLTLAFLGDAVYSLSLGTDIYSYNYRNLVLTVGSNENYSTMDGLILMRSIAEVRSSISL